MMKKYLTGLITLLSVTCHAQQDTVKPSVPWHPVYVRHSFTATLSLGFIDNYRKDFAQPAGFEKNNTSGYANAGVKLEYGVSPKISIAAIFGYDAFVYNYSQLYTGYTGNILRYKADHFRMFSAGLAGYYHLGDIIRVRHLDPFAGIGLALNNLRYSSYPQGDSTAVKLDHTVTLYLKAGARYYISDQFSVFVDAGWEKQSILGIGASCRFFGTRKQTHSK